MLLNYGDQDTHQGLLIVYILSTGQCIIVWDLHLSVVKADLSVRQRLT